MKLLLDSVPEVTDGTGLGPWLDRVESVNDEALALSQRADVDLATLETAVKNQVQRAVDLVDSPFKKFVEPALSKATALGDRSYEQSASVALDAGYTQAVRGLADYILDLGSEEGREAFERAVGFRTAWLGRDVAGLGLPEKLLSDFVVADGLATEDLGKERPRVERVAQAMSDVSKSHTKIVFSGLALQTGFEEKNENQGVFVEDESGRRTSWRAHVWEFTRSQSLFGASEREALRSGFLAPGEAGQEGAPVYWFQWTKDFGPHDAEPVKDALAFVLNEVGPRAVAWGVPSLYAGELPGRISANLSVAFSGPALDRFFDADVTSDALVWQALGRMAETYDNQFGLPFAASPRRPTTLVATPGASEACERVAKQWGGLYCFYIEEELLPALRRARGGDALARMQFFRGLYTKGFLANKVGSRMLVRLVHETLYANGTKDGIYTKVAVSNGSNDGASASPTLVVGESPEGDVMEGVSLGALPK
jgi:hypothetical protein